VNLSARIHLEGGSYWADVAELPGCFAAGDTLDELFDSLKEGVALCLGDEAGTAGPLRLASATLTDSPLATA
jgi:predicted RNase H-like HicB family nuclease